MFLGIFWLAWMPKNAKTIVWAKLKRQDVFIAASDSGKLPFLRGNTEGPGIFRSHDGKTISFIPRGSEAWINKTFHYDKIGFFLGYVGKAISGSFETFAVFSAHEMLQERKNEINRKFEGLRKKYKGKTELEMQDIYRDYLKTDPEGRQLFEAFLNAKANITSKKKRKGKDGKTKIRSNLKRLSAILLDPRVIQNYFTNSVQPSQADHLIRVAYDMGFKDGSNPMAKMAKYLIVLLIIIIPVALIALLLLGSGAA